MASKKAGGSTGRRNAYQIAVSSDKCDFQMFTQGASVAGRLDPKQPELTALLASGIRASSSKCDWTVGSLRDQVTRPRPGARASSSKCDFQVISRPGDSYAEFVRRPNAVELAGGHGAFGGRVASSKCDFEFIGNLLEQVARVRGSERQLDVDLQGARVSGRMSSDKCDFDFTGGFNARSFPELTARMSSSKCEFNLQVEFGIRGGQRFKLRAVSSSKCDFQLQDIRTVRGSSKAWKPVEGFGRTDR